MASTPPPLTNSTTLPLPARLILYLGPPSTILLTSLISPKTALLSPLVMLPTCYAYTKYRSTTSTAPAPNSSSTIRHAPLTHILTIYGLTSTLGLLSIATVQAGLCRLFSRLLFYGNKSMEKEFWVEFGRNEGVVLGLSGEALAKRVALAGNWRNWVFNTFLAFVVAGGCEEALKFAPVAWMWWREKRTKKGIENSSTEKGAEGKGDEVKEKVVEQKYVKHREYIDLVLAGALSFGFTESLAFIYGMLETPGQSHGIVVLTILERLVLSQAGHLSVAALTALRATRSEFYSHGEGRAMTGNAKVMSWWRIIAPAVFAHGLFDFVAMSGSAWEGNVGWIHPRGVGLTMGGLGLLTGLVGIVMWEAKREWSWIQRQDAKRETANEMKGGDDEHED